MAITLDQLAHGLNCQVLNPPNRSVVITDITTDSREVTPGSLFVALPGRTEHGFSYIDEAKRRGAVAVAVFEPLTPAQRRIAASLPGLMMADSVALLPELSARVYNFPARQLRLHGITGTNGKTTTAYMLASILKSQGRRVAFWTTNQVTGVRQPFRPTMTTPHAPTLQRYLREARDLGAEDVILEVSSHALALNRIGGLTFASAAITNITPDHLDFHGTFEAYVAAKVSLMHYIQTGARIILNADDPVLANLTSDAALPVATFGFSPGAHIRGDIVTSGQNFTKWICQTNGRQSAGPFKLPVAGKHNLANALCAISMARELGIEADVAGRSLERFVPAQRRLETVTLGMTTFMTDVAMNRGSYDAVIQTVADLKRPVVVVNAIRGNRGSVVNSDIAATLANWNNQLKFAPVIVSLSRGSVERLAVDYGVRPNEYEAFAATAQKLGLATLVFNELEDAIDAALERLNPNGVLLLLGTFGMDEGLELAVQKWKDRTR